MSEQIGKETVLGPGRMKALTRWTSQYLMIRETTTTILYEQITTSRIILLYNIK